MVFETLVTDILNRVLGDFIENLDSKQLSLGIWGGDVELKDLVLKQSAIDELDLPLQIAYGRLGNLSLKIPWKNLYSSAVEASIDGLYLVLVPSHEVKYDPEKDERKIREVKQSALARIEERKKREIEDVKTDDTFVEKLLIQIIKNLQVKIANIHVRYEDKITKPGHPFALGITLSNLSVDTTDENWKPKVVEEIVTKIYKAVQLDALSVYWNCDSVTYSHLPVTEIVENLVKETATNKTQPGNYNYVLSPITSSVRLKLNPKPEKDKPAFAIPKVHLDLEMEKLGIGLSKNQYLTLISLVESLDLMAKGLPYRKYRPNVPSYKGHYKEWWLFAYTCVLEGEVRRKRQNWNWDHIKEHRRICKEYADVYKEKLINDNKLSEGQKKILKDCEDYLNVTNIVIIRRKVELHVERLEKLKPKPKGWFSNWWWSGSDQNTEEPKDIVTQLQEVMTVEEKQRLYQAIDYNENMTPTEYPEAYVDMSGVFLLKTLVTEIYDMPNKVLSSKLSGVKCNLETRAGANSIKVTVNVDSLTAQGIKQDNFLPVLIAPMEEEESLLNVVFETNPLNKKCGQRLTVELKPLKLVYDTTTINGVVSVFSIPESSTLEKLSSVAATKLNNIKKMSASGLQHIIESHSFFDVNIDISAPIIIIPEGGRYTGAENILAINLGKASIVSVERSPSFLRIKDLHAAGVTGDEILNEMIEKSYDRFLMNLTEVQVILASPKDDWMGSFREKKVTPLHLLQPLSLEALYSTCLIRDDPQLPLSTIKGELPSLTLAITDTRLIMLLSLIDSISAGNDFPEENKPLERKSSSLSSVFQYMENSKLKSSKGESSSKTVMGTSNLVQFTELDVKFVMKELTLNIGSSKEGKTVKELANFVVNTVEFDFIKQTFNTEIWLRMGSMKMSQFASSQKITILDTPLKDKTDYMFTVQFVQVDKMSPEFYTTHQSCEQRLIIKFNSLDVHLNQEALQKLVQFVSDIQVELDRLKIMRNRTINSAEDFTSPKIFHNVISEITEQTSNVNQQKPIAAKKKPKKTIVETIKFKLIAGLEQVKIKLSNQKFNLASLAISGMTAEVITKEPYTQIKAQLLDLSVLNLNPVAIYSKILSVTSDEAINVQIVFFNIDEEDIKSTNMSVEASVGCLRIVYLNQFVSEILAFINNFQTAADIIAEASQSAAQQAKLNMEEAISKALKIALNINIRAPNIVVPVHSQSKEALLLDLGRFTLVNKFMWLEEVGENKQRAVLDEMILCLEDTKMAKITFVDDQSDIEHIILDPLSFQLKVVRNLSSWYHLVPNIEISMNTKTIMLSVTHEDYKLIMNILNKNLGESQRSTATSHHSKMGQKKNVKTTTQESEDKISEEIKPKEVHTLIKFTFVMERFIFSLYSKSLKKNVSPHDPSLTLANFSLEMISIKGRMYSDDSMGVAMMLSNCVIEDTRPDKEGHLTRLFERKVDAEMDQIEATSSSDAALKQNYMVDIVYQQKQRDNFVNIRICSFALIFNAEFILQILDFVKLDEEVPSTTINVQQQTSYATLGSNKSSFHPHQQVPPENLFTLNLKVEKQDVILVEHLNSIDTNALILNFEMLCKFRTTTNHQVVNCSVNDLQMYTCVFDPAKREETKANVILPININVAGSTPEGQGLHVEVFVSDVRVRVSPLTIDLLNRVNKTLVSNATAKKEAEDSEEDFSTIWQPKPYKEESLWFLKAEIAEEAALYDLPEMTSSESFSLSEKKQELCIFMIKSIIFTMEAGVGKKTLPMIYFNSKFSGSVKNWSSELQLESAITLQMGYYNGRLALWEPLVEPVQIVKNGKVCYEPWELKIELYMKPKTSENESVLVMSPSSEGAEEIDLPPAPMVVNVMSFSNLELTVTKTFLEVLNNLSKAFTDEERIDVRTATEVTPFKVINDTGVSVVLLLGKSTFQLYGNQDLEEVTLEPGTQAPLELQHSLQDTVNFQDEMLAGNKKTAEKFIFIKFENSEKPLKLPFEKADKRYFTLDNKTNKGLISEVSMENGVLSLTLRSILQIYNHFNTPVDVYYRTERSNNLMFIRTIQPGSYQNLPFVAVYTSTFEIFFSVHNYAVTTEPFVWKDLNSTVAISKILMCPSKEGNHFGSFILNASGKMKQVFNETSNRYTMNSVCYKIYLKPVVIFKNCLPFDVVCIIDHLMEEYLIEPGATAQLPNVQPGGSSICLKIPDYLEKEWTCKNTLLQNPSEFTVWQFSSYDNIVRVNLDLGLHCKMDSGSMTLTLYCPFWLVNKTGVSLEYRTAEDNMNVISHPDCYDGPILFSFTAKNFFGKKKASIRVIDGDWSDKFPLDVAGSSGYVLCKGKDHIYSIGVRNTLSHNGLTKQVTFTPYYVIINNAKYDIECQEFDRPADAWFSVKGKSCSPFWPRSEKDDRLLKLRVAGTNEVTPPFLFSQTNNILLQLKNKYGGIHADVQITESSVYINLHPYSEGLPPPMIINNTDKTISYWEKETVQIRKLDPGHSVLYTWANPPGCRVFAWDIGYKKELQDELITDGLKEFTPMDNYTVYWVSFLNGMQRIILYTTNEYVAANVQTAKQFEAADTEINVSIHGIGLSLVNNVIRQELMYMAIANSGIIWEFAKLKSHRFIEMAMRDSYLMELAYQRYLNKEKCDTPDFGRELVDEKTEVDFQTLMMIKPRARKLRRVFQCGLWIQMKTSPYQLQFHAKVNKVQIDNQLFDCIFPIVLAPVLPPRTMADKFHRPFIEVSIVQRVMKYSQITQFKYFKVLIQEFHIKVDIGFVIALLDLLQTSTPNEEEERKQFLENVKLSHEPLKSLVVTISQKEQKNFYDLLHFSPLKIHVSFSLQSGNYKGLSQLDLVNILLQGLGVTLTDMQDVIFKLAFFERSYTFLSHSQLTTEVISHYSNQAIKQLYVLVLGLDVLGNPYGLVLGITKGFEDFFYEPIQGAIQGPGEFAEGLVLGTRSLFSHTVGGAAGAVSRITGAMGKGIAALTFDKDFQRRRRDAMTKKPASVQEGLARGGKGLVMGVFDGVTGVFTKPISGAKQEGVEGFFKGLGKGAIGLVTRPTAGVIDFASGSFEAVKRATDLQDDLSRLRPSRYLHSDGLVRPYNLLEAEGHKILVELEKGKYANTDVYVSHYNIGKDEVLLLTDKRIACVTHSDVFGGWQMEWAFAWSEIPAPATIHPKGVQIPIPEGKKKKIHLFSSNGSTKLIPIQNDSTKEKIVKEIENMRASTII